MSDSDKIRLDPATLRFVAGRMREELATTWDLLPSADPMTDAFVECITDMADECDKLATQEEARRSLATPDLDPNEIRQLASQIYECAIAWEPEARLLGNVQAVDVARVAMFALNALAGEVKP